MKVGDIIQANQLITSYKKPDGVVKVYAMPLDLLVVHSIAHTPVLLVRHYENNQSFAVHQDSISTELHPKNKHRIQKDLKAKHHGN